MSYSILDNRKMYTSTSLEYEKNVHSITSIEEDNIKQQQDYSYGNPLQDDIYLSRYNSFLTGNRDVDILPKPYTEIKLEKKEKEDCTTNQDLCKMSEDGVTNVCGTDKKLSKILDPRFNLREAAKNLILLEDHLFHSLKRCNDCIKKHCLLIEGFLEEGITLDKTGEYTQELIKSLNEFSILFQKISTKMMESVLTDHDCMEIAQELRKIRKPLCQKYATFF
jgi:hypothetical protein